MRPNYISVLFLLTLLSAGFFYFSQKSNTSDIMVETEEENDQGEFLTPEHPLQIEYMRKQDYPGSDIIIEQTLSPESNYQRYIVSYQSEGLKQFALLTIPNGEAPDTGWPAILFNHGYINPSVYRTAEKYVVYTDYFSRNGYVLLKPDYRVLACGDIPWEDQLPCGLWWSILILKRGSFGPVLSDHIPIWFTTGIDDQIQ
ncbi:MAG: hypothetical protein UT85_C0042G0007 [Candidatus Levybacteria bacterium GW2011_GWA2_40_16]|nr:MAG: hypothetical protein UT85_C0042G0007 [Candidatus Levybacteria bacterium GW2011_GWA2_40_16]